MQRSMWFVFAAAACGSSQSPPGRPVVPEQAQSPPAQPPPTTPPNPGVDPQLAPPIPAIVRAPQTRPPIPSPHGGSIDLIAVTPDGSAAISADELHGVRLWPALDGTQEPLVVSMPASRELALGKRTGGFTAVALDDVGGLIINTLDPQGRLQTHATLAPDPAFTHVAMSDAGLVALRSDQTVLLIGDDGSVKGMLAGESGQQIVDVMVDATGAIAVIEKGEGTTRERRGRELTLSPKLAWGAFLGAANTQPEVQLAVSPSRKRIAWLQGGESGRVLTVLDLSKHGAQVAQVNTGDGKGVDFLDDDHVVYPTSGGSFIVDVSVAQPAPQPLPVGANGARFGYAVAAGRVVAPYDNELVLVTPKSTSYLGFGIQAPTLAGTGPKGQLVVGLAMTGAVLQLDDKLDVAGTLAIPLSEGEVISELAWLGDTHWAIETTDPSRGGTVTLELVDVAKKSVKKLREGMKVSAVLTYEPATSLLTLSFGDSAEVYRYDARAQTLGRVAGLPAAQKVYEQTSLMPVVPKLAGGIQMIRLSHRDVLGIQWLGDARALDKATYTATADSFASADAAGHVYAWRAVPGKNLDLVVFEAGKVIATLPADGPVGLWPDPTGTRVLEIGQRTVALYSVKGKLLWTQQLVGAHEAYWVGSDAVGVISAAGVARLDAKTGDVQAARCGWSFGLSPKPHPTGPQIEPVCAQLDR